MNTESTEAEAIASIAQLALVPKELEAAAVYLVPEGNGSSRLIDTDEYGVEPRRATGARSVTDAASFVEYVNRHKTDHTEIYAHTNSSVVVAVLDSHAGPADPGWQGHKVTLELEHSKAWVAWVQANDRLMDQQTFADFLDDRYIDVREPAPAVLIDIARTFQAKTKVDFESGFREGSGDVTLNYVEETTAKAGQKGDIQIPSRIQLALRPYVGGPIYSIWVSFRYRLNGGNVTLGFRLERPENVLEAAFADIVAEIRDGRMDKIGDVETLVHGGVDGVPIFNGRP